MIDKEVKMETFDNEKIKSEEDDIDIAKEIYLQEMHASKELFIKALEKMDKRKRKSCKCRLFMICLRSSIDGISSCLFMLS